MHFHHSQEMSPLPSSLVFWNPQQIKPEGKTGMRKYDLVSVHAQSRHPENPGCKLTGLQLRTESSTQERLCVVLLVGPTAEKVCARQEATRCAC